MILLHLSRTAAYLLAPTMLAGTASIAYGQDYPTKPVRFVTSEPGGGADTAARIIARGVSGPLGQPIIIDNRPAIIVPGDTVAKAPPDGYTLLIYGGTHWLQPFFRATPYDPIKDFTPVTLATSAPSVLVVHPSMPVKSVKELIALAKARPGKINYGSSGVGSAVHLAAELFKSMADIDMVQVNYRGTGPAVAAVIAGEVQVMFPNATAATPHIKSGRLHAIAVCSPEPSTLLPGLPTVASSGLPGFESASILGIFGPAKMPDAIVVRLNQGLVRFLKSPDAKERFAAVGSDIVASTPAALEATVKSEMMRMGKVIRNAGIRSE